MTDLRERALDILARLGAQPATAFMEGGVAGVVREVLDEANVPHRTDHYGNIIAHLAGEMAAGSVPPIAFMAHMDHPGFEAIAVDGDFLVGAAMGGVPQSSFEAGVPLQVILPDGERLAAITAGPHGEPADRKALISLQNASRLPDVTLPASVAFDLVDFQLEDGYIRMRALDDLAGCGSTLAMLCRSWRQSNRPGTCTAFSPGPRRWAWWAPACWLRRERCRRRPWWFRWSPAAPCPGRRSATGR